MRNMQIAGTGNSRWMKSAIPATATWEEARELLRAGSFPFDLNGLNEAGILERGTPYDVENVLKDATAALFGLGPDAVPDDVLNMLKHSFDSLEVSTNAKSEMECGTYTGNNASTRTIPLSIDAKAVLVLKNGLSFSSSGAQSSIVGGFAVIGNPVKAGSSVALSVASGGFTVANGVDSSGPTIYLKTNENNELYHYIAFA